MRRPAIALCAACALTIGIPASIGLSADDAGQASRPLSSVPPVERFGQAALDAQSEFLKRMRGVEIRYGHNGAVKSLRGHTGIVLSSGLAGFRVGEPSRELLEELGPALLAAGTEELRVFRVATHAAKTDPVERQSSPERTIKTGQYIRGREVQMSSVNISINTQTNEIVEVAADFLPDRGLPAEPKLTAAEARAKVEAAMRDTALAAEQKLIFQDAPAHLAYTFEDIGENGAVGGALVWVFEATRAGEPVQASVNAITGEVIRLRGTFANPTTSKSAQRTAARRRARAYRGHREPSRA